PEVVRFPDGTLHVYAVLADGNVNGLGQSAPGAAFGAWQSLSSGGGFVGRPSVVRFPDGTLNVYARSASGAILARGNTATGPGTSFGDWQQVAS
ncbi:hypothetical protein ACFVXG_37910, partial [Kitasatospora sp. NPDC058162]